MEFIILMDHHDYAAALFSNKERDVAWLSPLALGEVSVVAATTSSAKAATAVATCCTRGWAWWEKLAGCPDNTESQNFNCGWFVFMNKPNLSSSSLETSGLIRQSIYGEMCI